MKAASFTYHRPGSVDEAVGLLGDLGDDASVLSGGQSLIPMMSMRLAQPSDLIDLGGVPGLAAIRMLDDRLVIGARVTHQDLVLLPLRDGMLDALREAGAHVGHIPIRTRGTFGGSIAHADSKSEWCVLATAFGGEVIVRGPEGRRALDLDGYFVGPYQTVRSADEILVEVRLRRAQGAALVEHATRHGDFAAAIVASAIDLDPGTGTVVRAGIAVGGVRGVPVRAVAAEQALIGKRPTADVLAAVARETARELGAEEADASYAALIVEGLAARALERAVGRATDSNGGGR